MIVGIIAILSVLLIAIAVIVAVAIVAIHEQRMDRQKTIADSEMRMAVSKWGIDAFCESHKKTNKLIKWPKRKWLKYRRSRT